MRINDLPLVMLKCLVWTIIIEVFGALLIGIRNKKDLINIGLVNIITNPLVVSISVAINIFGSLRMRNISILFLELGAIITEALIYRKYLEFKKINWYLLAIILNACSYLGGLLINMIN